MTTAGVAQALRVKPAVLVVDDEPGNLFTFRRVFASQYDITLASSSKEALLRLDAAIDERAFDVVLVDFAMPEMNGAEFLTAMRKKHPLLPCLFITAYAELDKVKSASGRYHVAAIILKPWEKDDVERRIEHALRHSKVTRPGPLTVSEYRVGLPFSACRRQPGTLSSFSFADASSAVRRARTRSTRSGRIPLGSSSFQSF